MNALQPEVTDLIDFAKMYVPIMNTATIDVLNSTEYNQNGHTKQY